MYQIVKQNGKQIIVCDGKQISKPWDYINADGLISGKSKYYVVYDLESDKLAIFSIDDPDNPVSKWHDFIYANDLLNGQSKLYIVADGKEFIKFSIDNTDEPIND